MFERICPKCSRIVYHKSRNSCLCTIRAGRLCRQCAADIRGQKQKENYSPNNNGLKYRINEELFIDKFTPESAYILGLLWADGYLGLNHTIKVSLISEDMTTIANTFDKTGCWGKYEYQKRNWKPFWVYGVTNHRLYNFLTEYGYKDKEQPKILDIIPKHLLYMWYRGYVDGDGSWYINDKHYLTHLCISAEYDNNWKYMTDIFEELKCRYHISQHISKKGHRCSKIRVVYKHHINIFGDYLYQDNISIGFPRKYKKFLDIKSRCL